MTIEKVMTTEFRNLTDRVVIHCPTFSDFEKVKAKFNVTFSEKNVWSKHKENTGISFSFVDMNSQGCILYANYGNINGSYKVDGYKVVKAKEVVESGVSFTDSGYNFVMAKVICDLQDRIKQLEERLNESE
jgi:hypothetical protein